MAPAAGAKVARSQAGHNVDQRHLHGKKIVLIAECTRSTVEMRKKIALTAMVPDDNYPDSRKPKRGSLLLLNKDCWRWCWYPQTNFINEGVKRPERRRHYGKPPGLNSSILPRCHSAIGRKMLWDASSLRSKKNIKLSNVAPPRKGRGVCAIDNHRETMYGWRVLCAAYIHMILIHECRVFAPKKVKVKSFMTVTYAPNSAY